MFVTIWNNFPSPCSLMEEYSHLRKVYLYLHLVYLLVHWHSADMADMVICLSWLNLGPNGFPALCLVTILMGWTRHVLLTRLHGVNPWSITDYSTWGESVVSYWLLYTGWIHDLLLTRCRSVIPYWQLYTGCIRGLLYFTQGTCIMSYLLTTVVMHYPNFLLPI